MICMSDSFACYSPNRMAALVRLLSSSDHNRTFLLKLLPNILYNFEKYVTTSTCVVETVIECLDAGAEPNDVARVVVPEIARNLHGSCTVDLCVRLLLMVAERVDDVRIFDNALLFDALLAIGRSEAALRIAYIVGAGKLLPESLETLVVHAFTRIWKRRMCNQLCLLVTEQCLEGAFADEWRVRCIRPACKLRAHAWAARFGNFWTLMLNTNSFQAVFSLFVSCLLDDFVRIVKIHQSRGRAGWDTVWKHLCRHWPGRTISATRTPSGNFTCPITLNLCSHPALASDGHVYERDAIIEHVLRNGWISPMTRAQLEFHLTPVYV